MSVWVSVRVNVRDSVKVYAGETYAGVKGEAGREFVRLHEA